MSSGLAMTRRMSLRRIGRISASQARWKGSAVAITTSLALTSTGRMRKRVA
jgi:hypothetical protein